MIEFGDIKIDHTNDVIEIYGIKYSTELFKGLGFKVSHDDIFKIVERKDGVVTITTARFQ